MFQNYEIDLLNWVAREVCNELFAVAESDPKIMVNNWCAFAVLEIFREAASILDSIAIPFIDECMAGKHEPLILASNPKWKQLKSWHYKHWLLSQFYFMESQYAKYISMPKLHLEHYTLGL